MNNSTARILGLKRERVKNLAEKFFVDSGELVDSMTIRTPCPPGLVDRRAVPGGSGVWGAYLVACPHDRVRL
jgi:hypothetical protein